MRRLQPRAASVIFDTAQLRAVLQHRLERVARQPGDVEAFNALVDGCRMAGMDDAADGDARRGQFGRSRRRSR